MKTIKQNWLSVLAIVISIGAVFLVYIRIEPLEITNETLIPTVLGLMGICATIMVASQIMGLRYSETKISSMMDEKMSELTKRTYRSLIKAASRSEVIVALLASEKREWESYIFEIELLTSYAMDLKDKKLSNEIANMIVKAEDAFGFCSELSNEDKKKLDKCIKDLIRYSDSPKELLMRFKDVLHTTE